MIKATELRIGNWVLVCGVEIVIFSMAPTTNGRTWGFNLFEGEMPSFYDHECEPIPLTPEILERCGFEEIYKSDFTIRFDYKLNGKIGAGWNLINGHFHVRYIGEKFTHVKHLHQLQNLYFALTGRELEIKELQNA
jgi:hypothetical protein